MSGRRLSADELAARGYSRSRVAARRAEDASGKSTLRGRAAIAWALVRQVIDLPGRLYEVDAFGVVSDVVGLEVAERVHAMRRGEPRLDLTWTNWGETLRPWCAEAARAAHARGGAGQRMPGGALATVRARWGQKLTDDETEACRVFWREAIDALNAEAAEAKLRARRLGRRGDAPPSTTRPPKRRAALDDEAAQAKRRGEAPATPPASLPATPPGAVDQPESPPTSPPTAS